MVGLDLQVTGALGKRTKFQSEDFAQLTLNVGKKSEERKIEEGCLKDASAQVGFFLNRYIQLMLSGIFQSFCLS